MLKKWKEDNRYTYDQMAEMIGIHKQTILDIIEKRSSKTGIGTVLKIKRVTGLDPWEYLDGLEIIKKYANKNPRKNTRRLN
jgi:DNA-binding XRE family transcriptional regulator